MVVRTVALPASLRPAKRLEQGSEDDLRRVPVAAAVVVFAGTQLAWLAGLGYLALRLFG